MRKLSFLLGFVCLVQTAIAETVWIDTDVSIGSPIREVDDAYALMLAIHSPEIRIAGISTTYGNASLGYTTKTARDLVERFGSSAGLRAHDVHGGASASPDLGRRSDATDALASSLRKHKLTYIALGPLTNLAALLQVHPELPKRIDRIIFVGGAPIGTTLSFGPNHSFHIHDANVYKDPIAAEIVLHSGIPIFLAPVSTSSQLMIDAADLRELENSGAAGTYLARRSKIWLWFWTHIAGTNGGPVFDALALIPVTRPQLLSVQKRYAAIDRSGNLSVTRHLTRGSRPVRYCAAFAPKTKRFVMQRLREQHREGVTARQSKYFRARQTQLPPLFPAAASVPPQRL